MFANEIYQTIWVAYQVILLEGISQGNSGYLVLPISSQSNMQQTLLDYTVPRNDLKLHKSSPKSLDIH